MRVKPSYPTVALARSPKCCGGILLPKCAFYSSYLKLLREVTVPGHLGARKGVNTPDVILNMSPITPKDHMSSTWRLGNVPEILKIVDH